MFQTAFTLNLTQFARSLSLPERLQRTPARNLTLEALRQRNTALDALFYDVKTITPEEAFYISDALAAEGSTMIVPPSGAGSLTLCDTLEEFVLRGGRDVHVLAVAGVGSSALGSAAFARNVADAVGEPVAVVVSGYGLADVMAEALGGYFLFGRLNGLRHTFEILDELSGRPKLGAAGYGEAETIARTSLDTETVLALLDDSRLSFRLLTGHSKGNLVLSEALYQLRQDNPARTEELARSARIVTFSAKIAMPPVFRDVIDVLGEWDWFGEMNSRPFIATDYRVPHAWHHTNTDIAGHLPVTDTLRDILAASPTVEPKEIVASTPVAAMAPIAEKTVTSEAAPSPETVVSTPAAKPVRGLTKAKVAKMELSDKTRSGVTSLETARKRRAGRPKPR